MIAGLVHALTTCEDSPHPLLHLLGSPYLTHHGMRYPIPASSSRLLAFLAFNEESNYRRYVAAQLWPDVDERRAAGNLRSALWRLNTLGLVLVETSKTSLRLCGDVQVDVRLLGDWASRMISGVPRQEDLAFAPWDIERLEMLPGWYDDWIVPERERLRQRVLHGLDAFAGRLIVAGRCAEAVEVALVAVNADPLRETAVRVLIAAHLAEGNRGEADRRFAAHRTLMLAELGVEPSPQLAAMLIAADTHTSHREPL